MLDGMLLLQHGEIGDASVFHVNHVATQNSIWSTPQFRSRCEVNVKFLATYKL